MKLRLLTAFTITAAGLFLLSRIRSEADLIPHHGLEVDPNTPAIGCLACHDGSVADVVAFCTVGCNFNTAHSIERLYPPPGKAEEYVPLEQIIQAGIKLENGRISCISCHNLRNDVPYHLVINNDGSKLCLTCHRK